MNEQLDHLHRFRDQLISFNMALRHSMYDLQKSHDHVSPMWHDDMRKDYDQQWEPFLEMMKHYDKTDGPRYVEFLSIKIHALEKYLSGR
jgi:hypothetical protein